MNTPTHLILLCLGCALVAAMIAAFVNPALVKLAYAKRLLDNPNARKLQKRPVPVIGGIGVFVAATSALLLANLFLSTDGLLVAVLCLTVMFFTGMMDDMTGMSFLTKFVFQIVVILLLWYYGYRLDNLGGIFGIHNTGVAASLLLSLVAGVGLINAMNLIDGVDGLSSGLGMFTASLCAVWFILHGEAVYAVLAMCFYGALLPFFVMNVFSRKYKMFIGDSGSLVLGTLAYILTCSVISQPVDYSWDSYAIAFMLAIYAVPVYDTLRVMTARMLRGNSPFLPDKTHLHHIFVAMRYPHVLVTVIILLIATLIVLLWVGLAALAAWTGMSVSWVTIISVVLSASIVWGCYIYFDHQRKHETPQYIRLVATARHRSRKIRRWYHQMQRTVDRKNYAEPISYPPPAKPSKR